MNILPLKFQLQRARNSLDILDIRYNGGFGKPPFAYKDYAAGQKVDQLLEEIHALQLIISDLKYRIRCSNRD